jgi:hypothetical protein
MLAVPAADRAAGGGAGCPQEVARDNPTSANEVERDGMKRAQGPALALLVAACTWLPACGLNQAGVEPFADTIAFPASAVLDGRGEWLLVTNANADLRYNDGTLIAFSLARVAIDRGPAFDPDNPSNRLHPDWEPCPQVNYTNPRSDPRNFCCYDVVNGNRGPLNCDERHYVDSDELAANDFDPASANQSNRGRGNVRIGSFAAAMVLQRPKCPTLMGGPGGAPCEQCAGFVPSEVDDRLYIGVRGDTSLTFVNVASTSASEPPQLKCVLDENQVDVTGDFVSCDAEHRVIRAGSTLAGVTNDPDPPEVSLPDEPYALAVDAETGLLFIGHLSGNTSRPFTGGFSIFDVAPKGAGPLEPPRFIAPFPSPFTPNSVGAVGVVSLKFQKDTSANKNYVYASSRYVPQIARLGTTATCADSGHPTREIAAYPDGMYYGTPLAGAETRGIEFVGDRAFVLQRTPPALVGFLGTTPTDVLETCGSPTFLDQRDLGVGPRLFVTCFADGEIYVFDPAVPRLVKTFRVGRGPSGLVFDEHRPFAYVVGFGDNNVSVIDLEPGSPTEYQVVQRIGFPRTSPR